MKWSWPLPRPHILTLSTHLESLSAERSQACFEDTLSSGCLDGRLSFSCSPVFFISSPLCSATTTTPRCAAPTIRTTRTSVSCAGMPASSSLKYLLCQKAPVLLVCTFTLWRLHLPTVRHTHTHMHHHSPAVHIFTKRKHWRRLCSLNTSCRLLFKRTDDSQQM